jgi:hypothetical protein
MEVTGFSAGAEAAEKLEPSLAEAGGGLLSCGSRALILVRYA